MKHLETERLIDLVSANTAAELSEDDMRQAVAHLAVCAECRKKAEAFQTVYDRLIASGLCAGEKDGAKPEPSATKQKQTFDGFK